METEKTAAYVIDRFEDVWAVLEDAAARTFNMPRSWLPSTVKEGDVIVMTQALEDASSTLSLSIDNKATRARHERINHLRSELNKGTSGDIEL